MSFPPGRVDLCSGTALWECSLDLVRFIREQSVDELAPSLVVQRELPGGTYSIRNTTVRMLELGCGHGGPLLEAVRKLTTGMNTTHYHQIEAVFHDYDPATIDGITKPNAQKILSDEIKQKAEDHKQNRSPLVDFRFVSGSWDSFSENYSRSCGVVLDSDSSSRLAVLEEWGPVRVLENLASHAAPPNIDFNVSTATSPRPRRALTKARTTTASARTSDADSSSSEDGSSSSEEQELGDDACRGGQMEASQPATAPLQLYCGESFEARATATTVFDVILCSEGIYKTESFPLLLRILRRHLAKDGVALFSGKKFYFGCGGGTRRFLEFVNHEGDENCKEKDGQEDKEVQPADGKLEAAVVRVLNDKKSNLREIVQVRWQ